MIIIRRASFQLFHCEDQIAVLCQVTVFLVSKIYELTLGLLEFLLELDVIVTFFLIAFNLDPCFGVTYWFYCFSVYYLLAGLTLILESILAKIKLSETFANPTFITFKVRLAVEIVAFAFVVDAWCYNQVLVLRIILSKDDNFFILHVWEFNVNFIDDFIFLLFVFFTFYLRLFLLFVTLCDHNICIQKKVHSGFMLSIQLNYL